ncbi:uncharacterized protein PAC_17272 [Phialocephala subalpina]|uniref:Tail specific protease domain-containing protein n=1 Tax=Phialocephala subalpina TaxID=576137 RepID=A0A1L7XQQ2_9HELO|nr:uncharacterized protein PAC_17272 [Phialocephala subalpina]
MKAILQTILLVVGTLVPRFSTMAESSLPSLPTDHPASIQFSAWLAAFNTEDQDVLAAYHSDSIFPYSAATRDIKDLQREFGLAQASGGFEVVDIESVSSPSSVVIVMKEKKRPIYARVSILIDDSNADYPVTEFQINAINTPLKFIPEDDPRRPGFEKALKSLDSSLRRKLVDAINKALLEQYVEPELGEKMANALNIHFESGDYDRFEDSEKFAQRLTEDLREAGHDGHMGIHFREPHGPSAQSDKPDEKPRPRGRVEDFERMDYSFGPIIFDTGSAPGKKIASLTINGFVPSTEEYLDIWKEVRAAIGKKLSSVADADALIVDLRQNHGGAPDTVAFMMSYLMDGGPHHLLDFVDRAGTVDRSFSTLPVNELPGGTKAFGGAKPLYVLTTKNTVSGGEDMTYGLQAFKRALAVIGEGNEATAGAANPITKPHFLCEEEFGEGWWMAGIPIVKPKHPVTGTNWEGIGVKSDIVAGRGEWEGVDDAKEVATRLLVKFLGQQKDEL